ncbi:hypothetical protein SC81_23080, partial [Vibrio vulnificus]
MADEVRMLAARTQSSNQVDYIESLETQITELPRIRRAKAGHCVTQLHYARKGIITPEMEYIALRVPYSRAKRCIP